MSSYSYSPYYSPYAPSSGRYSPYNAYQPYPPPARPGSSASSGSGVEMIPTQPSATPTSPYLHSCATPPLPVGARSASVSPPPNMYGSNIHHGQHHGRSVSLPRGVRSRLGSRDQDEWVDHRSQREMLDGRYEDRDAKHVGLGVVPPLDEMSSNLPLGSDEHVKNADDLLEKQGMYTDLNQTESETDFEPNANLHNQPGVSDYPNPGRDAKQSTVFHHFTRDDSYTPSRSPTPTPKHFYRPPPQAPTSHIHLFLFSTLTFILLHHLPFFSSWTRTLRLRLGFYPALIITLATSVAGGTIFRSKRTAIANFLVKCRAHPASREFGALLAAITLAYICAIMAPLAFRMLHSLATRIPILGPLGVYIALMWWCIVFALVGIWAMAFFAWDVTKVVHGAVVNIFRYVVAADQDISSASSCASSSVGVSTFRVVNVSESEDEDIKVSASVSAYVAASERLSTCAIEKGKMAVGRFGRVAEAAEPASGMSTPRLSRNSSFTDRRMAIY
ncbi:hypothetical protein SpCBS45565_g04313 [Spizellomyces sp. 'palustris']|nr:hypothetical protein SpCBS45565_g04313 [Spizellomyces sp. 'palustris']